MKTTCVSVLCLGLISLCGCNFSSIHGSGLSRTESRAVGSFSRINLTGSPEVEVTIGSPVSVSVTTDDNLLPVIETTVSGDTFGIGSKQSFSTRLGVKVSIVVPSLDSVSATGSGTIHATGLKGREMDANVTGSGDIILAGVVDRLTAHVTGSGTVRAGDLAAKRAQATVTGSGNVQIRATEEVEANIVGSGSVRYSGNPPQVRRNIIGSGAINPL